MSLAYIVDHAKEGWETILDKALRDIRQTALAESVMIRVDDVLRSLDQNKKQWAMLRDISRQVPLTVNGQPRSMKEASWKAVLTAIFTKEVAQFAQAPGYEETMVALGVSTSGMSRKTFREYIEFLYAYGTDRGVAWSEKAKDDYQQYRPQRFNGETL